MSMSVSLLGCECERVRECDRERERGREAQRTKNGMLTRCHDERRLFNHPSLVGELAERIAKNGL